MRAALALCLTASAPTRLLHTAPRIRGAPSSVRCAESGPARDLISEAVDVLQPRFREIDAQTEAGLRRVLGAFRRVGVGPHHFAGVNGYGHGDLGREALDSIYAELMGAEAAWARVQCFSGTHAIACALFGALRPGDELLAVSGAPYDTLEEVLSTFVHAWLTLHQPDRMQ